MSAAPALRIVSRLGSLRAADWDALHDGSNPFVSHAFLYGLEQHGCLREDWGWQPQHLTLWQGDRLVAAAPGYLKTNSHGEFVFDHAWAHAYQQAGLAYYPKWLGAVPYSPTTGPRLLAGSDESRAQLLAAIPAWIQSRGLSSAHLNFLTPQDDALFNAEWLQRQDVQFHWTNPGWQDFEGFLAALDHKHRKNIRQERRRVASSGITVRQLTGRQITDADLDAMYGFYLRTFAEYGNHPALTRDFLRHLRDHLPGALVILLADDAHGPVAGALCLRGGDTLYGRYWGSASLQPGLHFELCYYQGIEYCLRHGLRRFEPGAQGEHKLARGFLPTRTRSRHWIAEPSARSALAQWCEHQGQSVSSYADAMARRTPFRNSGHALP